MPILSAGQNLRIPHLHDSCTESGTIRLLRLEPSRWLHAWWLGSHGLLVAAVLVALPGLPLLAAALPLLVWHLRRRRPREPGLILLAPGPRFALPLEGRFGLSPTAACREGPFWLELAFDDARRPVLVLADQLDPADWRHIRLLLRERR